MPIEFSRPVSGLSIFLVISSRREIEGKKKKIEWGSQIRSYVLDDRRIKDHRTNYERFDVETVLDGDLDEFMEKYLSEFGD